MKHVTQDSHRPHAPIHHAVSRPGFESAYDGYKHGHEDNLSALAPAPENGFEVVDTSSTLGRYGIVIVAVYLAAGCAFFSWSEDWRWDDSLYFCVVTMTTVGYGDLVPMNDASKVFAIIYIILGML